MKRSLIVASAACAVLLTCCRENRQYTLAGRIDGLEGKVYVEAENGRTDSVEVAGGLFEIVLPIDEPMMVALSSSRTPWAMNVLVDSPRTVLEGSTDGEIATEGSVSQRALDAFLAEQQELLARYYDPLTDQSGREAIAVRIDSLIEAYIAANRDNLLGAFLLYDNSYEFDSGQIEEQIALFTPQMRESFYLRTMAERARKMKNTEAGRPYIDVSQPTPDGEPLALSEVLAEGGYVLLDFWASWCPPCMREVPYLVAAYRDYRDKGFDIYGVSLDSERDAWIGAIEGKQLDWHHVSTLTGWDNPAAADYSVRSIPANFLVGPDGTIVAKNLRGEDLAARLSELLDPPAADTGRK